MSDPQQARIEAAAEAVMAGYVLHGNLHGKAIELPKIKIKEIMAVALAAADRVDPLRHPAAIVVLNQAYPEGVYELEPEDDY